LKIESLVRTSALSTHLRLADLTTGFKILKGGAEAHVRRMCKLYAFLSFRGFKLLFEACSHHRRLTQRESDSYLLASRHCLSRAFEAFKLGLGTERAREPSPRLPKYYVKEEAAGVLLKAEVSEIEALGNPNPNPNPNPDPNAEVIVTRLEAEVVEAEALLEAMIARDDEPESSLWEARGLVTEIRLRLGEAMRCMEEADGMRQKVERRKLAIGLVETVKSRIETTKKAYNPNSNPPPNRVYFLK